MSQKHTICFKFCIIDFTWNSIEQIKRFFITSLMTYSKFHWCCPLVASHNISCDFWVFLATGIITAWQRQTNQRLRTMARYWLASQSSMKWGFWLGDTCCSIPGHIFAGILNLFEFWFCHHPNSHKMITPNFFRCHHSCAVVTCEKTCSYLVARDCNTVTASYFPQILIASGKNNSKINPRCIWANWISRWNIIISKLEEKTWLNHYNRSYFFLSKWNENPHLFLILGHNWNQPAKTQVHIISLKDFNYIKKSILFNLQRSNWLFNGVICLI